VEALALQDEQALRAQLSQARQKLAEQVADLRALDRQIEGMSDERKRYRLVGDACGALQELSGLGAASLFWGERAADGDDLLRLALGRLDAFQKRVTEIEDRRQAVFDEVQQQQEETELLEDDLLELERQAEERKLEWLVERDAGELRGRELVMAWSRAGEEDERFRKTLAASLLLSLLLALVLPQIDLPLPEQWEPIEVPERLTRLIREELPPPPPPVAEVPKPEEPKPLEELPQEVAKETAPKQAPAKESAASKGILAFREKFSGLADSATTARLGSAARISTSGAAATGRPQRSMVTTQAPGSSGGINLAALSRDVGGGGGDGISGVQVARATSSIAGAGESDRPLAGGPAIGRTDEEIQIVFDRYKAALYRLYNRELRSDPTLKGQLVLRIRIEPDGSVTLCELQSTDMKAPQLVAQVLERVRTFDFGAKDVPALTILYPIDFLPAT
jgi:hypothetical protein